MSNEFENEIKEELFSENITTFFKKNKFKILFLILFIILVPLFFQIKNIFRDNKNQKLFFEYSNVFNYQGNNEDILVKNKLSELIESSNEIISLLAFNKLIDVNKDLYLNNLEALNNIAKNQNIEIEKKDLISIKKSLLVFDTATESQMLELLDIKNNKSPFYNLKLQIIRDYYQSKNQLNKVNEINLKINEK